MFFTPYIRLAYSRLSMWLEGLTLLFSNVHTSPRIRDEKALASISVGTSSINVLYVFTSSIVPIVPLMLLLVVFLYRQSSQSTVKQHREQWKCSGKKEFSSIGKCIVTGNDVKRKGEREFNSPSKILFCNDMKYSWLWGQMKTALRIC